VFADVDAIEFDDATPEVLVEVRSIVIPPNYASSPLGLPRRFSVCHVAYRPTDVQLPRDTPTLDRMRTCRRRTLTRLRLDRPLAMVTLPTMGTLAHEARERRPIDPVRDRTLRRSTPGTGEQRSASCLAAANWWARSRTRTVSPASRSATVRMTSRRRSFRRGRWRARQERRFPRHGPSRRSRGTASGDTSVGGVRTGV
jgi:hypothetical protein